MPESAAELEQRAERAVRRGELHAALALFDELIELAPPGGRADLASAEQLPAPASAHAPPRSAARSTKVADANFAPIGGQAAPLPRDPVKMLEALLERIRAGRRDASTRA